MDKLLHAGALDEDDGEAGLRPQLLDHFTGQRKIVDNLRGLAAAHGRALGTRLDPQLAATVLAALPGAFYDEPGRTVRLGELPASGPVLVLLGHAFGPALADAQQTEDRRRA